MLTAPERRTADFKIFTGPATAKLNAGRKVISCTASSSVVDLHGDEITAECVADMAQQALTKGMTIFLNHSYKIPEDTFGTTVAASSKRDDAGVALMDLQVEVDESNPRALQTYSSIIGDPEKGRKGLRLGVSIGAQITEWEFRDSKKEWAGGIRIKGVDLLEASVVGIPANQRSWVHNAVKSLRKSLNKGLMEEIANAEVVDLTDEEDDDLDDALKTSDGTGEPMAGIEAPADGTEVTLTATDASEEFLAAHPEVDAETLTPDQILDVLGGTDPDAPASSEDTTDPVASAPDGDSRGDEEVAADQSVEDVVASAADIAISDSDRPVLAVVLATLEGVASELRTARSALTTAEAERDEAIAARETATKDLTEAQQIIEAIARLPLGRKARFVEPVQSFRQKFSGIYPEDFLRLIDERQDS